MLASFVSAEDTSKVHISLIKRSGKDLWLDWQKRQSSLRYTFEQDLNAVVQHLEAKAYSFNNLFETLGQHPPVLKLYINKRISLETLIILDMILGFSKQWDKDLKDPLWEQVSFKIKKYKPFLSINTLPFRKVVKETFL
jgi:hypothetical protein